MGIPQVGIKEFIDVPIRIDTALDMSDEEYDAFIKAGCDKSLLKLHDGQSPILFRLRKVMPYRFALKIDNMKMDMVKKKEGDKVTSEMVPKMSWIAEEVRFALVDIINPPGTHEDEQLEFKRDSDGVCSDEIMSVLMSTNSHMDLWQARQALKPTREGDVKKK